MTDPTPSPITPSPITVVYKPSGPIIIHGTVVVLDNDGQEVPQPPSKREGEVKLCGCGYSRNKPFCDGSHKR